MTVNGLFRKKTIRECTCKKVMTSRCLKNSQSERKVPNRAC